VWSIETCQTQFHLTTQLQQTKTSLEQNKTNMVTQAEKLGTAKINELGLKK